MLRKVVSGFTRLKYATEGSRRFLRKENVNEKPIGKN